MSSQTYKAMVVREEAEGDFVREIKERTLFDLPDHEVLIRVHYSSLNYKDALSASGNKGVTRNYPHTPGIDAAGIVVESRDSQFSEGDKVIVTGYDLGQNTSGGFGEYIRVPADWVVLLPEPLTLQESMTLGTAGFTAALGVYKLKKNQILPESGEILVTGATGGVGSLAVALLSKAGYEVTAATGKTDRRRYLDELGATRVIDRSEVQDSSGKPLLHGRWAGVIETVGGIILDTAIRQTKHNGTVACCGNILGHELHTNVYPFILRGVSLTGLDSGNCEMDLRKKIWHILGEEWKPGNLRELSDEITLEELDREIKKILRGDQTGRIVINLNK